MPTPQTQDRSAEIVLEWLSSADADTPAGPLFTGGTFAEADIVGAVIIDTLNSCSSCTHSGRFACC